MGSRGGQVQVAYGYGPQRAWVIYPGSQYSNGFSWVVPIRFYGYDGHGSVRYLTDESGALVHTYDYDAFGNLVNETDTPVTKDYRGQLVIVPANTMRFAGEQWDPDLGLYYNRARYLDVRVGRFWGMDTFEGRSQDPFSLHKYLYAGTDPVNRVDPSGHLTMEDVTAALGALMTMASTVMLRGQQVLQSVYLNLYRIPQIIDKANTYLTIGQGLLSGRDLCQRKSCRIDSNGQRSKR